MPSLIVDQDYRCRRTTPCWHDDTIYIHALLRQRRADLLAIEILPSDAKCCRAHPQPRSEDEEVAGTAGLKHNIARHLMLHRPYRQAGYGHDQVGDEVAE